MTDAAEKLEDDVWVQPVVEEVLAARLKRLNKLRNNKRLLAAFKEHYKDHPWDFIEDWGMTYDPRLLKAGKNPVLPFTMWPRQREFVMWLHDRWQAGERGLAEKSRDGGATWLCVGWSVSMWLFHDGFAAGFGSRKEALVDKKGDPDCIFEKVRFFIDKLPALFKPEGFDMRQHATFMKVVNPKNEATITGEAGDDIGRGGRKSAYIVDEAAFIQHQEAVDASLSQTTDFQLDLSTPNGNGNEFYKKRMGGKIPVFTMHWSDDPRKDKAWYDKQVDEQNAVTVAQEIDIDYNASVEDIFIPAKWVEACVDAHEKLGIEITGADVVSFDPADVGDAKARGYRKGNVTLEAEHRRDGDITTALPWAFELSDSVKADVFVYDADGMGATSMKLYLQRATVDKATTLVPFYGGGKLWMPGQEYSGTQDPRPIGAQPGPDEPKIRRNKDVFVCRRDQAWTNVRDRMELTYRAVVQGKYVDPDKIISISSGCKNLFDLKSELSRPLRVYHEGGKIKVESKKQMKARGVESPNLADQFVYSYDFGSVPVMPSAQPAGPPTIPKRVTAFSKR